MFVSGVVAGVRMKLRNICESRSVISLFDNLFVNLC